MTPSSVFVIEIQFWLWAPLLVAITKPTNQKLIFNSFHQATPTIPTLSAKNDFLNDFKTKQSYPLWNSIYNITPLSHQNKIRKASSKSKMVKQLRASLTCFSLLLLFVLTSLLSVHSSETVVPAEADARELHQRWQKKTYMNHGSFRGARKRLVNPTVELPFQARQFPV